MIRAEELAAGFATKKLFSRLSFSLSAENSPLVLLGGNGSGKSTLLRILAGFRKPEEGLVKFIPARPVCGWLPQQYRVGLEIPVVEFVTMACDKPLRWFSQRPAQVKERSMAALEKLGIEKLASQNCTQLSGGEWQLACMAQMLAQDAPVWILDEPTSSLDIAFKKKIMRLLWEEASGGRIIIFSTHDLPFLPDSGGTFLLLNRQPQLFENKPGLREKLMEDF